MTVIMYEVADNAWNRANYADLIGNFYFRPPAYAACRPVARPYNESWRREQ
jgi:hypothetical protein